MLLCPVGCDECDLGLGAAYVNAALAYQTEHLQGSEDCLRAGLPGLVPPRPFVPKPSVGVSVPVSSSLSCVGSPVPELMHVNS